MSGLDLFSMIGFAVTGLALFAWEMRGVIRKKKGDTISEFVWWLDSIWPGTKYVVLGFLAWLAVHFFFSGRFG